MIDIASLPSHMIGPGVGQYDPTTGIYNAGDLATVTVSASDDQAAISTNWLLWAALAVGLFIILKRA